MRKHLSKRGKRSFQNFLLTFSLVVVLILIIILSCNSYFKTKHFIEKQRQESIQVKMDHISRELQTNFEDGYHKINNLKTNESVIQYLKDLRNKQIDSIERYNTLLNLQNYLYSVKQDNPLIDNILIVTQDSQYSSNKKKIDYIYNGMRMNEDVANNNYFVSIGEANDRIQFTKYYKDHRNESYMINDLNKKMFFGTNLETSDGRYYGTVLIFIKPEYLSDQIFYADNIALFDANYKMFFRGKQVNKIIADKFEEHKQSDNGLFLQNKDVEVYSRSIPYYNFKLIYSEQTHFYRDQMQQMWKIIVSTLIFAVVVAMISSSIISRRILQPLYQLLNTVQRYQINKNRVDSFDMNRDRRLSFSLRERFFFYFLISILLPLLLFLCIYYWQTSKIVSKDLQESFHTAHERLAHIINNDINQHEQTISQLSLNPTIQNQIISKSTEEIERELMRITQTMELNDKNIGIYSLSNELLYSTNNNQPTHLNKNFYQTLKESNRRTLYFFEKDGFDNVTIILGRPIFSVTDFSKKIGFITTEIDNSHLVQSYSIIQGLNFDTFILDTKGTIVSHQDGSKIGSIYEKVNNDNSLSFSTKIGGIDWVLTSKYNYSDIQKQVNQLFLNDLYLLLIILLLILLFSYWVSKRLLKPFGQLNRLINLFDLNGSHYTVLENLSGIDEVDLLSRNFKKMMDRMDDLIHDTIESNKERIRLKYEKRELQINALQSQINPHFLYNTLDNLMYLVESEETEKSVDMIYSLSKLFRFITSREQSIIRIQDELAYTKTYVTIMSYRFDNFQCIWNIDKNVLNYKTLKLILQPVIENSIQHGAKMTKKNVTIEVGCEVKNDTLVFSIKDDALGIDQDRLLEVQEQLESDSIDKAGIFNVNSRIKLHYGSQYGLNIDSKKGEWTRVTIVIPAVK